MNIRFAERVKSLKFPKIEENYKYWTEDAISLADGQPDPLYFPVEALTKAFCEAVSENPAEALSYGNTDGRPSFRKKISDRVNEKFGAHTNADQVCLVGGSQQGLDFTARVLLNEGETIACEQPTYFGCFQAVGASQPKYRAIPTDAEGILPDELDKALAEDPSIRLIYVIPNFQNPTGRTWSLARRKAFMEVVNKYEIPVLEDDAYGELRYEGEHLPSLKSMDTKGLVIYSGSFSKIMCPGLRLAYLIAEEPIRKEIVGMKGNSDMHVPVSIEMMMDRYLDENDLDAHVANLVKVYREKRDVMVEAIREFFPKDCTFRVPEGGLFVWVSYPETYDSQKFFDEAGAQKVIFVQGELFYADHPDTHTMRLNFSFAPPEKIREGIRRLGVALERAKK